MNEFFGTSGEDILNQLAITNLTIGSEGKLAGYIESGSIFQMIKRLIILDTYITRMNINLRENIYSRLVFIKRYMVTNNITNPEEEKIEELIKLLDVNPDEIVVIKKGARYNRTRPRLKGTEKILKERES